MAVVINTLDGNRQLSVEELHRLSDGSLDSYVQFESGDHVSLYLDGGNLQYVSYVDCYLDNADDGWVSLGYMLSMGGNVEVIEGQRVDEQVIRYNLGTFCRYLRFEVSVPPEEDPVFEEDDLQEEEEEFEEEELEEEEGEEEEYVPPDVEDPPLDEPVDDDIRFYGFKVCYGSDKLAFGTHGDVQELVVDTCFGTVQRVPVGSNDNNYESFCVFIADGPTYKSLELSCEENVGFMSLHERGKSIPKNFPWGKGKFHNTTTSGEYLIASGINNIKYTTPILHLDKGKGLYRVFCEGNFTEDRYIDNPNTIDGYKNIGVRVFNSPPGGLWVDGELADESDPLWSVDTGGLGFVSYPNDGVIEKRYVDSDEMYVQLQIGMYGDDVENLRVNSLGIEYPVVVSGTDGYGSAGVYIRALSGDHRELLTNIDVYSFHSSME